MKMTIASSVLLLRIELFFLYLGNLWIFFMHIICSHQQDYLFFIVLIKIHIINFLLGYGTVQFTGLWPLW